MTDARPAHRLDIPTRDVVIVIVLLVLSGDPPIQFADEALGHGLFAGIAVLLTILLQRRGLAVVTHRLAWITGLLVGLQIVQAYQFDFLPIPTVVGLVVRLCVGACLVRFVSDFPAAFVRAMVLLSSYFIAMYVVDQLSMAVGLDFRSLFSPIEHLFGIDGDHRYVFVYTFSVLEGTHRNCGFFAEPGLFAGYLLLALLMLGLLAGALPRKTLLLCYAILVLALATTFSTAGYLLAPLVLAAAAFGGRSRRQWPAVRVMIGIVVASGLLLYIVNANSDFLEAKILHQLEETEMEGQGFEIARFGAALLDVDAIRERPLVGWGLHESTKFALTPELSELAPSGGVTGWARSFGLCGLLVLLVGFAMSVRATLSDSPFVIAFATLAMLLIAQPNTFLNYPFFLGLMFLGADRDRQGHR